jgi:hypothetical protein
MGVRYLVLPFESDGQLLDWLQSEGVEAPPATVSRYPSPKEFRTVLSSMAGYTTEYEIASISWRASVYETASADPGPPLRINGPHATIFIPYHMGDESLPHEIHFDKSWPEVIVAILTRVASVTGPLVLLDDSDVNPVVIQGGEDVQQILNSWKHTAE